MSGNLHEQKRRSTRDALRRAALDRFAKDGFANVTVAELAEAAGVTQRTFFRHFPTKDAILEAVMTWVAERLLSRVDKAAQNITSPLAALEAVFMAHIDFVSEHPGVPRMLFGELQRPGETLPKRMVQTLIQRYGERLRHLLERGKAIGELDANLDIEAASVSFIGSIQGLVMQSLIAGDAARIRRDASGVFAIYRRGIGSES